MTTRWHATSRVWMTLISQAGTTPTGTVCLRITTPTMCWSTEGDAAHARHRRAHRRHEVVRRVCRWDAAADPVPSDRLRGGRMDVCDWGVRGREPHGDRRQVEGRRYRRGVHLGVSDPACSVPEAR